MTSMGYGIVAGTDAENVRRMSGRGRGAVGTTLASAVFDQDDIGLKQRLETIDGQLEEFRELGMRFLSGQPNMFLATFLIIGALKRTLSQAAGICEMVRSRNTVCAMGLLRMQLDTVLRLHAMGLHGDMDVFADAVHNGVKVSNLKSADGIKLTDAYLHQSLSERFPWVSRVYSATSGYVHLSRSHFYQAIRDFPEAISGKISISIAHVDPERPASHYYEALECLAAIDEFIYDHLSVPVEALLSRPKEPPT
jgi:hypothetical protein